MKRDTGNVYLIEKTSGARVQSVAVDLTGLSMLQRYERLDYLEDNLMIDRDPRQYRVDCSELMDDKRF